jgi:hypothetical protein
MSFQRKMIVVALACAMPWMSAHAQSAADLKKEIESLKAQLQMLTQKVEAMSAQTDNAALGQQVNRIEQRLDLADSDADKTGFKGVKINGVIEASFSYDDLVKSHNFTSGSGYGDEFGMLQITKESQDGEGVDWTLRLLPGNTTSIVHEASISIPLDKENRIIGGLIPDYQGYEYVFSNANSTLGNQLITHNALYDLAGPTAYAGIGMSHTFSNGTYALKWIVGNIDPASDPADSASTTAAASSVARSVGFAARGDWYINEYSYMGLSVAHGSVNRNFDIVAIDGGYTRGDWALNAQLTSGMQRGAAANGENAEWTGISGLVSYKVMPRLQLLARADFIDNRKNGGGTYAYGGGPDANGVFAGEAYGLGPERDSTGSNIDPLTGLTTTNGASLTRLTIGTNYQINANTQWKTEYRIDQSSGFNFLDADGVTYRKDHTMFGTSLVLSF